MTMGKLVVIDGIDGSGKSTLAKKIADNNDMEYLSIFEERYMINELIQVAKLDGKTYHAIFSDRLINYAWMIDLYVSANEKLVTLLRKGKNVILDRYILSAKVYSLATTTSDISKSFDIYSLLPVPHVGLYLSIDVNCAVRRIEKRKKIKAFYENKEDLLKIAETYEMMLPKEKSYPIITIKGNDDIKNVYENSLSVLNMYGII